MCPSIGPWSDDRRPLFACRGKGRTARRAGQRGRRGPQERNRRPEPALDKPDQRWIFGVPRPLAPLSAAWSFPSQRRASENTVQEYTNPGEASPSSRTARGRTGAPPPQPCGFRGMGDWAVGDRRGPLHGVSAARSCRFGSTAAVGTPNSNPGLQQTDAGPAAHVFGQGREALAARYRQERRPLFQIIEFTRRGAPGWASLAGRLAGRESSGCGKEREAPDRLPRLACPVEIPPDGLAGRGHDRPRARPVQISVPRRGQPPGCLTRRKRRRPPRRAAVPSGVFGQARHPRNSGRKESRATVAWVSPRILCKPAVPPTARAQRRTSSCLVADALRATSCPCTRIRACARRTSPRPPRRGLWPSPRPKPPRRLAALAPSIRALHARSHASSRQEQVESGTPNVQRHPGQGRHRHRLRRTTSFAMTLCSRSHLERIPSAEKEGRAKTAGGW